MGCLMSLFRNPGHETLEEEEPKVYSWDKKQTKNVEDYIIDGKKGETVFRLPGSVNGEQILIQNCENCNIYIFDFIATVSVDDCINCSIFLGPIKQSVFIRDSKQCRVVVACQQYRTRDCFQIDTFLLCGTQPIIESSSRMKFACFSYHYKQLEDQFRSAGLSLFNNNWSNIHDFTPEPGEEHFSYIPLEARVEEFVPIPEDEFHLGLSTDGGSSVVPHTNGKRRKPSAESCLIVFFNDDSSSGRASKFLQMMRSQHPQCVLIQTKEVVMSPDYSQRVFNSDTYITAVQQGPVIGLELNGEGSNALCASVVAELTQVTEGLVFVSRSPGEAEQQIEAFYNYADMQMGI